MIFYLIMGFVFTVGLFSNNNYRNVVLGTSTFLQKLLILILPVIFFPFFIGFFIGMIEGDELREQVNELREQKDEDE